MTRGLSAQLMYLMRALGIGVMGGWHCFCMTATRGGTSQLKRPSMSSSWPLLHLRMDWSSAVVSIQFANITFQSRSIDSVTTRLHFEIRLGDIYRGICFTSYSQTEVLFLHNRWRCKDFFACHLSPGVIIILGEMTWLWAGFEPTSVNRVAHDGDIYNNFMIIGFKPARMNDRRLCEH